MERLRAVRLELQQRRAEIDRELRAVENLIATYVSYQPALAVSGDIKPGRARNLGSTLLAALAEQPGTWLGLADLASAASARLPGIQLTEPRLRNALYHLVKTEQAQSRHTDAGIQYAVISTATSAPDYSR